MHVDSIYSFSTTHKYILHFFRQISLLCSGWQFLHFILLFFFPLGFRNKTFQGISFYVSPCMQLHEFFWDLYLEPQFLIRMNNYFEFCRHCLIASSKGQSWVYLPPAEYIPVATLSTMHDVDWLKSFCHSYRCEMVSCNYLTFHMTEFQA